MYLKYKHRSVNKINPVMDSKQSIALWNSNIIIRLVLPINSILKSFKWFVKKTSVQLVYIKQIWINEF